MLGAPFEDRGARADDAIRALRAVFGRREPTYEGPYYSIADVIVDPHGLQLDPPVWIGGRSQRSLRRAVELGDGWYPFAVSARRATAWLAEAAQTPQWQQRTEPLEVILGPRHKLDPVGNPDQAAADVREVLDAGATGVSLRFVHDSLLHYLEQLDAMRGVIAAL